MPKKLLLVLLTLALVLGGVWLATRTPSRAGVRDTGEVAARDAVPAESTPLVAPESTEKVEAVSTARRTEALAVPAPSSRPVDERLAGMTGRVVEFDGTPVPGMNVALLEADAALLLSGEIPMGGPDGLPFHLDGTVTDEEGRFELDGAWGSAFHGLGLDLGGMRASLRVLDQGLVNGERTDLGDVVLEPWAVLSGRVVDERGSPVAGARVRVLGVPDEVFEISIQDVDEKTVFHADENDMEFLIEMPARYAALLDQLPIPTVETDADGAFRFEGISMGRSVLAVNKDGHPSATRGDLDVLAGENDVGEIVMSDGRSIAGVVVDGDGEPVSGVEILAGAEVPVGHLTLLRPAGTTGPEGRFGAAALPLEGDLRVAARRDRGEHWVTAVVADGEESVVELPSRYRLTVLLRQITGEPVSGATIEFERLPLPRKLPFAGMFTPWLEGQSGGELRETEPGTYVADALPAGDYRLGTNPEGFALLTEIVAVEEWDTEEVLVVDPGQSVAVLVVDQVSGEPVTRAKVRVALTTFMGFRGLISGETGSDGRVTLGPFTEPEEGDDPSLGFVFGGFEPELQVVVDHPSYPRTTALLEDDEAVVELPPGGTLRGRVHLAGEMPMKLYAVVLIKQQEGGMNRRSAPIPQMTLTAPDGSFVVRHLEEDSFELHIMERFLDRDPFALARDEIEPRELAREDIEIVAGETTELEIDLGPSGLGPTAVLRGTVRVDGLPFEGANVRAWGSGEQDTVTDAWGRFEMENVSTLRNVFVRIEGDLGTGDDEMRLFSQSLELEEGEVRELEVSVHRRTIEVHVKSESTGQDLEGATVWTRRRGGQRLETDAQGLASIVVVGEDTVTVRARLEGYSEATAQVELASGEALETIELVLGTSVPFRGRMDMSAVQQGEGPVQWAWLSAQQKGGGASDNTSVDTETGEFEFDGLKPGVYELRPWANGVSGEPVEVELGPDGETNVQIVFVPVPESSD